MKQHFQTNGWLYHNIIPITLTLLTWAVSFGILTTKVDYLIKTQDELKMDFQNWKRQYEVRLNDLEIFKGKVSIKLDMK